MQIGISTASLFVRKTTEYALRFFSQNNLKVAEVFLESYCEYNSQFGKLLKENKGDVNVHSIHVLTTQFEPQLYSVNERAKTDSFKILEGALDAGKEIGAKYYTFHGPARLKKTPIVMNFERLGKITQEIIDVCATRNIGLAYENVHWSYYNYIGYFKELKQRTVGLKGTLDIKQARQSDISYVDFINEMKEDIVTVHLSGIDANGKMCLPNEKSVIDYYDLFSRLKDVGFNGAMLLEVYQNDYNDYKELFNSLNYVKTIAEKVFKR